MAVLKLPALKSNFDEFMTFVLKEAEKDKFDKSALKKIRLACEEIIINVINYAYPDSQEGDMEIICDISDEDDIFTIMITDWGVPFNPLEKEEPDIDVPAEERPIGGLGIFLTRKVMDTIDYQREGDKNVITLTKNYNPGKKE